MTRRFGTRTAVQDLSLEVREGDVYGFLGPNGAGKTTAMRCILGLIQRDAGEVRIFGSADPHAARKRVGAIIETPAFHPWMSGRRNLRQACLYAGLPLTEVDRVLERVGLADRGQDPARSYSLGMKQRLGIGRALLGGPTLLMLDEPTNGLDPRGMREVRELIRSLALNDRITIFISSHLLTEIQSLCNRVGILQRGELQAQGTVTDLLAQAGGALVDVGTTDPEALLEAIAEAEGAQGLEGAPPEHQRVQLGAMGVAEFNRHLVERGVAVTALVPVQRNLEDVFLELTT